MLTCVEQALGGAEAAAAQREQALHELIAASSSAAGAAVLQGLDRFREHVRGLTDCAAQADALVGEADAALGAAEDALRAWFQGAEATRRTLASWASKA
jgi:hypothetical protein